MSATSHEDAKPKRVNPNQHIIDQIKKVLPPPGEDWGFYIKGLILGIFILLWMGIVAAMVLGVGRGGSDSLHELAGSVVITNPENYTITGDTCHGAGDYVVLANSVTVKVERAGKGPLTARLGAGAINAKGACVFGFSLTTADADNFIFSIGELEPISRTLAELNGGAETKQWTTTLAWDS